MDRFVSSSCRFAVPGQKPLGMSVYRSVYPSSTAHPLEMPQSHSHLQFIKEEDYYFGTPHLANPCSLAFLGNEASHSTSNYVDHHHMLGSLPSTSIKQNSIIHAAAARNNMVKSNTLSCYETLTAENVEASNSSRLGTPQVFDGTPLSREWYSKSECFGGNGVETFTRDYPPQGFGRAVGPDMYHLPLKKQHTSQALYCLWMDHCLDEGSKKPCNRMFHQLDDLVNHLSVDHVNINYSNGYECRWKDCDRGELPFKERYRLVNHLRVHTGEKPFQCPFSACRKRFSRPENMKIHIRTHTGEKPFPCEFAGCGRRFANSSDRKKHSHVHRSDKPYLCGTRECKKRYTDPSSLRKHMKLHEPGPVTPLPAHDDMFFSC